CNLHTRFVMPALAMSSVRADICASRTQSSVLRKLPCYRESVLRVELCLRQLGWPAERQSGSHVPFALGAASSAAQPAALLTPLAKGRDDPFAEGAHDGQGISDHLTDAEAGATHCSDLPDAFNDSLRRSGEDRPPR